MAMKRPVIVATCIRSIPQCVCGGGGRDCLKTMVEGVLCWMSYELVWVDLALACEFSKLAGQLEGTISPDFFYCTSVPWSMRHPIECSRESFPRKFENRSFIIIYLINIL